MAYLRESNRRSGAGSLLSAAADWTSRIFRDGRKPAGLYLTLTGGEAARLRLTVGAPEGGVDVVREFTLTRRGAWCSAAGWSTVNLEVLSVGAGAEVGYAWTALQPPDAVPMMLFESIAPGTYPIPAGAARVATSGADAGWSWTTDDGGAGAPYVIPTPATGAGAVLLVLGATYTATANNVLAWHLEAP